MAREPAQALVLASELVPVPVPVQAWELEPAWVVRPLVALPVAAYPLAPEEQEELAQVEPGAPSALTLQGVQALGSVACRPYGVHQECQLGALWAEESVGSSGLSCL